MGRAITLLLAVHDRDGDMSSCKLYT